MAATQYWFLFSNLTGGGTVVINTTTVSPTVHIHIIDHNTGNPNIREAQLGQELEFRIDVDPDSGNKFVFETCSLYELLHIFI